MCRLQSRIKRLVLMMLFIFILLLVSPFSSPTQETSSGENRVKWIYEGVSFKESSPVIGHDGTIYIAGDYDSLYDNFLYAINPDGTLKWRFETRRHVETAPVIALDGTIYVGDLSGYFYAINPNGVQKWMYIIGSIKGSAAIGYDGTIYIGSQDGFLYAFNPNGSIEWKHRTGLGASEDTINKYFNVESSPAIGYDGTIYVGSKDRNLYAITPYGTLKWKFKTANFIKNGSPSIARDGTIYMTSHDGNMYAINPDGTLKWKYTGFSLGDTSPAIAADGTFYVGSYVNDDRSLYAFSPDGAVRWTYQTGGSIRSSPAIGSDGTIYFASNDGFVYAVNPDGTIKWNYNTQNRIQQSPSLADDGTLYIGNSEGLFAIQTDSHGYQQDAPWPCFIHNNTRSVSADSLNLPDLYTVSGQVMLPDSTVLEGIEVSVDGLTTESNIDGNYSFLLPDGAYRIYFEIDSSELPENIDIRVDGSDVTVQPNIEQQYLVRGRLTENGLPMSNITVTVKDLTTLTDKDGYYTFFLKNGTYTITYDVDDNHFPDRKEIIVDRSDIIVDDVNVNVIQWEYAIEGIISDLPSISRDGTIYLIAKVNRERLVYAINQDGTLKGCYDFNLGYNQLFRPPSIADDGTLYFPCWFKLLAVRPDGIVKWDFPVDEFGIGSPPAISADGSLYFGSRESMYALNPDGTLKWKKYIGNHFGSSPSIDSNGIIYFSCYDNNVYAITPDGSVLWIYSSNRPFHPMPAIGADGTIYVGGYDKHFHAINPDGTLKWKYEAGNAIWDSPIIDSNNTIFFMCQDRNIYALNPDGTLKWKHEELAGFVNMSMSLSTDNDIIASVSDGYLISLKNDGVVNWKYRDNFYLPVIAPNGTMYVISYVLSNDILSGYLISIQTGFNMSNKEAPWPCYQGNPQRTGVVNNTSLTGVTADDRNNNLPGHENDLLSSSLNVNSSYPNPFNTSTTITYTLPSSRLSTITIYNINGQKILDLVSRYQFRGTHRVTWNGCNDNGTPVSSGVYFFRVVAGNQSATGRMLLMK